MMKNIPFRVVIHEIYSYFSLCVDDYLCHENYMHLEGGESNTYQSQESIVLSFYGYFKRDRSRTIWTLYKHITIEWCGEPSFKLIYPLDSLLLSIAATEISTVEYYFNNRISNKIMVKYDRHFDITSLNKENNYKCVDFSYDKGTAIFVIKK